MRMPIGATMLFACAAFPFAPADPADPSSTPLLAAVPGHGAAVWREAYAGLVRRADRGDANSARLALEMFRHAPRLYGEPFDATPLQLQRWACRAHGREPPCADVPAA